MPSRPKDEEELQRREAIGVIRASRFVRKYARSHEQVSMQTICNIHKEIFKDAWPEIAGKYRQENLKITDSKHLPPHHSTVVALMEEKAQELEKRLKKLEGLEGIIRAMDLDEDSCNDAVEEVVRVAAWLHHAVTFVHPFREGNGRTARLAGNLVLEHYGLVGISIKIEKENKNRYRQALAQIDKMDDFESLIELIYDGLVERYEGVAMKYYHP